METMLQEGLKQLIDYATGYAVDEIRQTILDQFPQNEMFEVLKIIFDECLVHTFNKDSGGPDWDRLLKATVKMGIGAALDEVRRLAADGFVDAAFSSFDLDDPLDQEIKQLVREVLRALTTVVLDEGDGMKIIGDAMDQFASGVGSYLLEIGREELIARVEDVFDRVGNAMRQAGVPAIVCDFLVGFARDLLLEAVPQAQEFYGTQYVDFNIDTDRVIDVMIKHGLYNVVLRWFYTERTVRAVNHVMHNARAYVPEGEGRRDWGNGMIQDFSALRIRVHGVQAAAVNALTFQDHVGGWAEGLEHLESILKLIEEPLDFIAAIYPPLQEAADAVHRLIIVLNATELITRAVNFGLKINQLNDLGKQASDIYLPVLPD